MTFPGAGTTYTTYIVKKASNTVSATNYGNEYLDQNNVSVPLYSDVAGPYLWQDENMQGMNVPSTYILTKTHCGGRCQDCPPNQYMETLDTFMQQCLRAPRVVSDQYIADIKSKNESVAEIRQVEVASGVLQPFLMQSYSSDLVKKMVHVVKSPFSNVVSRFHHEYKSIVHKFQTAEGEGFKFTYDQQGFQAWCQYQDNKYIEEERAAYGETFFKLTDNVPCHADFYRYVQWHNLASDAAVTLNIKAMEFNHEDYGFMMYERVTELLDYLELPMEDPDFIPFHELDVKDHFTDEQMKAIAIFIRALASDMTWSLICGYVPPQHLEDARNYRPPAAGETFCDVSRAERL